MVFWEGLGDDMRPPTFLGLGDTRKGLPSRFSGGNTFFLICPSQGMAVHDSDVGPFSGWNRPHLISCNKSMSYYVPLLGTGERERTKENLHSSEDCVLLMGKTMNKDEQENIQ